MNSNYDSPRPLLDWVLGRGREVIRLRVARTGERYRVSVSPAHPQHQKPLFYVFRASPKAFQRHAALVASFREAGWTSVTYR